MYKDFKNGKGRILFFSGSNHTESINQMIVAHLAETMGSNRADTIHLKSFSAPLYSLEEEQTSGIPNRIAELIDLFDQFENFVIAVPENNGSVTAFFKNTLDWISRARKNYRVFQNKRIFLIAVSPGNGGRSAIRHARDILRRLGGEILGEKNIYNFEVSQFKNDANESDLYLELQGMAYAIDNHFGNAKIDA